MSLALWFLLAAGAYVFLGLVAERNFMFLLAALAVLMLSGCTYVTVIARDVTVAPTIDPNSLTTGTAGTPADPPRSPPGTR